MGNIRGFIAKSSCKFKSFEVGCLIYVTFKFYINTLMEIWDL